MKGQVQRGPGRLDGALAEVMHRERDQRSWRQVDLAKHLRWPLSRVTRIEAGMQRVLVKDLLDLCRVLEMGVADLLSEADPADLKTMDLLREIPADLDV